MHCHIYSARANVCGVFSIGTTPVLDPHEDLKSLRKILCSNAQQHSLKGRS